MSPSGGVAIKPKIIIKGWSGVTADPSLLAHGTGPLLVFSGQDNVSGPLSDGCVVGALPASPQWQVQSWSLSQNCVFSNVGYGDAAENRSGQRSAAWSGGAGGEYRLGISPTNPAGPPDPQSPLPPPRAHARAGGNN